MTLIKNMTATFSFDESSKTLVIQEGKKTFYYYVGDYLPGGFFEHQEPSVDDIREGLFTIQEAGCTTSPETIQKEILAIIQSQYPTGFDEDCF